MKTRRGKVDILNKEEDELSSEKIKMKKTQLIFFYLKTAKKGMLNILNQCQDKNYVAYCTFYFPAKTQTSSIRYTLENKEEELSEEELTCFIEGQPEATIFYLKHQAMSENWPKTSQQLLLNN